MSLSACARVWRWVEDCKHDNTSIPVCCTRVAWSRPNKHFSPHLHVEQCTKYRAPPSPSLLRWSGHDRVNDHYGVCAMLERYGVHRRVLLRKLVIAIAAEWISLGKPCVSHSHSCLAWDTCPPLLLQMYSCVTVHVTAGAAASLVDRSADTVGCAHGGVGMLLCCLVVFLCCCGA